jgi:CheY-like chemotaxis protein
MPGPWHVLIADDDPEIVMLITTVLKKGPYAVTTCSDAETALVHIRRGSRFDLIISDFMMPGISGIDLIQQIRAHPSTAHTPILMISGHNNYAMDARAKSVGANAFLNKPFTLSQLRSAISSLLAPVGAQVQR